MRIMAHELKSQTSMLRCSAVLIQRSALRMSIRRKIMRVLLNLISNGFYATAKRKTEAGDGFEPTVTATTKNSGDNIEIRIRDNGTGIPDEVKVKVFNPFLHNQACGRRHRTWSVNEP